LDPVRPRKKERPFHGKVNPMRNALLGLLIAVVLALSASGASVFGIAVWKIALAAAGAAVFVMAGGK
jgi:hypothetical protein